MEWKMDIFFLILFIFLTINLYYLISFKAILKKQNQIPGKKKETVSQSSSSTSHHPS